jgi:hypothetical protein
MIAPDFALAEAALEEALLELIALELVLRNIEEDEQRADSGEATLGAEEATMVEEALLELVALELALRNIEEAEQRADSGEATLGAEEATMVEPVADPSPGDAKRETGDGDSLAYGDPSVCQRIVCQRLVPSAPVSPTSIESFLSADCGAKLRVRVVKRFTITDVCACQLCSSAEGASLARQASAARIRPTSA